jgi:hypothetical protein
VENRTGGTGTVQAAVVAKATPDGHTLLLISAQFAIGLPDVPAIVEVAPGFGIDGSHSIMAPAGHRGQSGLRSARRSRASSSFRT